MKSLREYKLQVEPQTSQSNRITWGGSFPTAIHGTVNGMFRPRARQPAQPFRRPPVRHRAAVQVDDKMTSTSCQTDPQTLPEHASRHVRTVTIQGQDYEVVWDGS